MVQRLKTSMRETKDILFYKGGEMGQEMAQAFMWATVVLSGGSIGIAIAMLITELNK